MEACPDDYRVMHVHNNFYQSKKDRLKALLQSGDFSDCSFLVSGEQIRAHKLILTCSSVVFEKMLYGDMASDRVDIPDIDARDFRDMLRFVYSDQVTVTSVTHAWSLFYIAHKYLLNDLADVCVTYVEKYLTIGNLALNYEYSEMYVVEELRKKCMGDIVDYVKGVLRSDYHMKASTLSTILRQDGLNVGPRDLLVEVINWGVVECDSLNLPQSPTTIVDLLAKSDILAALIKLLDVDSFDNDMTDDTAALIRDKVLASKSRNPPVRRPPRPWCTFCKTRQAYKIAGRMDLALGGFFVNNMTVNRDVLLFGLVVMTEDKPVTSMSVEYRATITVHIHNTGRDDSKVTKFTDVVTYEDFVYVPLTDLVLLEKNRGYVVKIGYENLDAVSSKRRSIGVSSILCSYMNCKLVDEKRKIIFMFDESQGSVVKGLCYYPA